MNLRRRRRVRTLALTAFALAALAWVYSIVFVTSWTSKSRTLPEVDRFSNQPLRMRYVASLRNGAFLYTNMLRSDLHEGWDIFVQRRGQIGIEWWPPKHFQFLSIRPLVTGPRTPPSTASTMVVSRVPVWMVVAITVPFVLLAHWRAHRPLSRLHRGLCHACSYDLNSTPPDQPCPECGSSRLALPTRKRRSSPLAPP